MAQSLFRDAVLPERLPPRLVAHLAQLAAAIPTAAADGVWLQAAGDVGGRDPALAAVADLPAVVAHVGPGAAVDYRRWAPGAPARTGRPGPLALVLLDDMTPAAAPLIIGDPPGLLTAAAGSVILIAAGGSLATGRHAGVLITERLVISRRPAFSA